MVFYCTSCSFCCNKRLDLIKHLFVTHSVEPNFYFVALTAALTRSSWALHSIRLSHTRVGSIPIGRNSWTTKWLQLRLRPRFCHLCWIPTRLTSVQSVDTVLTRKIHSAPLKPVLQPVYSRETSTSRLCPPAQKAAALFLLTFQERFKLSQSAINFAVGSINTIVDSVCKSVQSSVEGEVSATRLTESFDEREDPFAPLKTIHAVQVLSRALWIGCKLYTRKSAATLLHDTLLEKSLRVRNSNYIIPECCW